VDQRNKVKAFDTLSHRHQSQQARKEAKQEQRLTDEHAAKQFRDRTGKSEAAWPPLARGLLIGMVSASSPGTTSCPDRP
jgi:hypothetical protein